MLHLTRKRSIRGASLALGAAGAIALGGLLVPAIAAPADASTSQAPDRSAVTTTPIKHLVVIYDENVSFDHYFGTYPNATNTDGTRFTAAKNTPRVNTEQNAGLLSTNPNEYTPKLLTPAEAVTCDQNHSYSPEQKAEDGGKMDLFVQNTSTDTCTGQYGAPGLAMDYYDGNTVTAMWNYAQNYAMSDNSWDTTFGPSSPGALNLISGQTHGAVAYNPTSGAVTTSSVVVNTNAAGVGTLDGDADPAYDDCSDADHTASTAVVGLQGKNIGDLLNERGVSWGWFQGGFAPSTPWNGKTGDYAKCDTTSTNIAGAASEEYSPHHDPFQFYKSTSNPHHLPPSSERAIGETDQANHQYDLSDFATTLKDGNMPAVSFLKAPEAEDGHASYSDPLDEQKFLVQQINAIEQSKYWSSTAIVISYDDSDGWYDHQAPTVTNGSDTSADSAVCTAVSTTLGGYEDRCGPSQRLPMLVISPYSKQNDVDHTEVDQASITKFVEQNWSTGQIGDSSFDRTAGSIDGMFDFARPQNREVLLASNGSVAKVVPTDPGRPGGAGGSGKPGHSEGR